MLLSTQDRRASLSNHLMKGPGMSKIIRIILKILKVLFLITGILFVVYFWNLDQKLMAWAYKQVNRIFDRKKADIKF